ncbi:related to nuclear envelope protein NEM1 [Ustilago sp. UG-2017b]|nr:related to nuclear envelope protein NEM1 [Ustilago sp. UG-2017b]
MNSITYLDSVLSRSLAPAAADRPRSRASSSSKRSRSHSSLPGSRRASSTSPSSTSPSSTPSGSCSLRRWSQEQQDDPHQSMYNATLRRTGSTSAGLFPSSSSHALDTDHSNSAARWSGLWGLAGWIDEAIHPASRSRSRKNSDSEISSLGRTKCVPSLDDLLLSSTAPRSDQDRRPASSGSGHAHLRRQDRSSTDESGSQMRRSRSSRRQSRFNQSASLILTSTTTDGPGENIDTWPTEQDHLHRHHQDPELMTDKEREDVVEFDGGDFAPEQVDTPRKRTISQSSNDSNWAERSSARSHQAATSASHSPKFTAEKVEDQDAIMSQDQAVDSETLLEAAKGESEAIEAVAQQDPTSQLVHPAASTATPKKESLNGDAGVEHVDDTPKSSHRNGLKMSDFTASGMSTASASRRSSLGRKRDELLAVDSLASSSSSSLVSTDSEKAVDRSLTPGSRPRRRRSGRSSAKASETDDSRSRFSSNGDHNNPAAKPSPKRKSSSTKRAIRRTLVAIRDLLLAVLLCPINCLRYLRRRKVIRAQEAVEAIYQRSSVPVLEKNPVYGEERNGKPPSLRFKSDSKLSDNEKRALVGMGRPPTPKSISEVDNEPVTDEQAAELGVLWKALSPSSGQRTPSRLLPNPQTVDPMLANNSKAKPIDPVAAEKEAMMEAERQSRIAKVRAMRAAAKSGQDANSTCTCHLSASVIPAKVARGPAASSIIHHSPKILVLDLDETLIHSTSRSPSHHSALSGRTTTSGFLGLETAGAFLGLRANDNPRRIRPHMVEVVLDRRSVLYHVYKRPWADYFLRKVSSWYTVVIFTASVQEYADPVIDWLDQGRGLISARLFRESCSFKGASYVKNLKVVDQDLSKVCLVDNSPASYRLQRENAIPIEGWTHDPNDEALLDLLPVLDSLRFASDVRHVLGIRAW